MLLNKEDLRMTKKLGSDVSNETYHKFKTLAAVKFNFERAYTKKAVNEAFIDWINKNIQLNEV